MEGAYIFRGASYRREICISKLTGLIIEGKFVPKLFEYATGNIRILARNSSQINHTENAKFKHNGNKLY